MKKLIVCFGNFVLWLACMNGQVVDVGEFLYNSAIYIDSQDISAVNQDSIVIELLDLSIEAGCSDAMVYKGGQLVGGRWYGKYPKNYSWNLMRQAAKLDNELAYEYLAALAFSSNQIDSTIYFLEQAIQLGSANALLDLGHLYFSGDLFYDGKVSQPVRSVVDVEKGRHYIEIAAIMGNLDACYILAKAYYSGKPLVGDKSLALKWAEKFLSYSDAEENSNYTFVNDLKVELSQ